MKPEQLTGEMLEACAQLIELETSISDEGPSGYLHNEHAEGRNSRREEVLDLLRSQAAEQNEHGLLAPLSENHKLALEEVNRLDKLVDELREENAKLISAATSLDRLDWWLDRLDRLDR